MHSLTAKNQNQKQRAQLTLRAVKLGLASALLIAWAIPACSAPESTLPDDQEAAGGAIASEPDSTLSTPPVAAQGGAAADPHPLFGVGSYSGVDTSDPCSTVPIWKEDTAIDLDTGSVVLFEGVLWELSGEINENWALPACTPPGTGWCAEQYAWQEVGTCDD